MCRASRCAAECATHRDCEAGFVCTLVMGVGVCTAPPELRCPTGTECPEGSVCVESTCRISCAADRDCGTDEVCTMGACVPTTPP